VRLNRASASGASTPIFHCHPSLVGFRKEKQLRRRPAPHYCCPASSSAILGPKIADAADNAQRREGKMTAKDIMTRDVVTASPETSAKDLAKLLIRNQISGAPVVDAKGRLVGVVTETDILSKSQKRVKDLMTKRVRSVEADTPVEEIARLMMTHKINRIPVLDGKKLVGIVSRSDIVGAIALGKHIALHTPIYDL
jgi:CBS domain-containing protein